MTKISLTKEQAAWLVDHLEALLDDAHWNRGELKGDEDGREHCQTIHDKVAKELKSQEW